VFRDDRPNSWERGKDKGRESKMKQRWGFLTPTTLKTPRQKKAAVANPGCGHRTGGTPFSSPY